MTLHLEKKAIRALGIAESFRAEDRYSTLAGVVMRSDLVVDGFALGRLSVSGSDATKSIERLFGTLNRNDINAVLISGSVLSLYNILDVDELSSSLELPVVALTFKKSTSDLGRNIRSRFSPKIAKKKLVLLDELGSASQVDLKTGYKIFVRVSGISEDAARRLLDRFTLQGSVPEPVRLARLLSKSVAKFKAPR